jgi:WD40 repeat protein
VRRYDRSQFYVTGSEQGEIKCFSAIFNNSRARTQDQINNGRFLKTEPSSLALLHTFNQHSRAVTGLVLHPSVPGLMISTSIDGSIRVLNLEALNQLFEVNLRIPILNVKLLTRLTYNGMLFSCSDGSVKLWKIVSCCKFFGSAPSEITSVTDVFNLHFDKEFGGPRNWFVDSRRAKECLEQELFDLATSTSSLVQSSTTLKDKEILDTESSLPEPQSIKMDLSQVFISFSNQDVRLLSPTGCVLCRLEPEDAIQGIRSFAVSLYQELLFCLIDAEGTVVKIYDIGNFKCPLIATRLFRLGDQDQSFSMCLVDTVPFDGNSQRRRPIDALNTRGHLSMGDVDEVLVIGMYSGVLIFLDTLNDYDSKLILQAHIGGPIDSMVYRNRNKELFTLGVDIDGRYSTLKIWKLPEMKNTHVLGQIALLSYWLPSPSMRYVAVGAVDGALKLYMFSKAQDKDILGFNEVQCDGQTHDAAITAISFCDEKGIIATCASDSSVMFWNYRKNHLKTVVLNNPMRSLCSLNIDGDIIVTQRCYMLSIQRSIWDVDGTSGEVITVLNNFGPEADIEVFTEKDAKLLVSLCAATKSVGPTGGGHKSVTFITSDGSDQIFRKNVFIASNAMSRSLALKPKSPHEKEYFSMSKIPMISKRVRVFNTRHPRIHNIDTEIKEESFRNTEYCLTLDNTTETQTTKSNSVVAGKTEFVATIKHRRLSRPEISKIHPNRFLRDRNGLSFGPEHELGVPSRPLLPRSSHSLDFMRLRTASLPSNTSISILSEEEGGKQLAPAVARA